MSTTGLGMSGLIEVFETEAEAWAFARRVAKTSPYDRALLTKTRLVMDETRPWKARDSTDRRQSRRYRDRGCSARTPKPNPGCCAEVGNK